MQTQISRQRVQTSTLRCHWWGMVCLLSAVAVQQRSIQSAQPPRDSVLLEESTEIQSGDGGHSGLEIPRRLIDVVTSERFSALGVLRPEVHDPAQLLPEDDFIKRLLPQEAETIIQPELDRRREAWYRTHWLESYRKYATRDEKWSGLAEEFLEQSVTARRQGPAIAFETRVLLQDTARELLSQGCGDPLVFAVMLDVFHRGSTEHETIADELYGRFRSANYPTRIAFWAGCPHLRPGQIKQLQAGRSTDPDVSDESLFAAGDDTELRILFERLLQNYRIQFDTRMPRSHQYSELMMIVAVNAPTDPWLEHMLLAYGVRLRQLDELVLQLMTEDRDAVESESFDGPQERLQAERVFDQQFQSVQQDVIEHHLLTAWEHRPKLPEAATLKLSMLVEELPRVGVNRGRTSAVDPDQWEALFWFREALRGQFDHLPAYQTFHTWLVRVNDANARAHGDLAAQLAQECLDCRRFDTAVPARYFRYQDFLAVLPSDRPFQVAPSPDAKRAHYSNPKVLADVERLVDGYSLEPPPDVDLALLKSYLVCVSFLQKKFDQTQTLLAELGQEWDVGVFASFRFSPREFERELLRETSFLPFDAGTRTAIRSLRLIDDGRTILGLSQLGEIWKMDVASGQVTERSPPGARVDSLAVSEAGDRMFAMIDGQTVPLDTATGAVRGDPIPGRLVACKDDAARQPFWATADRPQGRAGMTLRLRDWETGLEAVAIETDLDRVEAVSFSGASTLLAVVGSTRVGEEDDVCSTLQIWDWVQQEPQMQVSPFAGSVTGVSMSPDGSHVVVRGHDWTTDEFGNRFLPIPKLRMYDATTGEHQWFWQRGEQIDNAQFTNDSRHLLCSERETVVRVIDTTVPIQVATYSGHNAAVTSLVYSAKHGRAISGDEEGGVRVWNVGQTPQEHRSQGFLGSRQFSKVQSLSIEPTTGDVITCTYPDGVIRWRKNSDYQAVEAHSTGRAEVLGDGGVLYLSARELSGQWFDQRSPKTYAFSLQGPANSESVEPLRVRASSYPVSRTLAVGRSLVTTGNVATVWNLSTGRPWRWGFLTGHRGPVSSVDVSADGRRIATRANPFRRPYEIRVWDVPPNPEEPNVTCRLVKEHIGAESAYGDVDLSNDGRLLLVNVGFKNLELRDASTGDVIGTVPGRRGRFSPDGLLIAVATGGARTASA